MKKAVVWLSAAVAALAVYALTISHRVVVLERTIGGYNHHFGYRSLYPCVGKFGVHAEAGSLVHRRDEKDDLDMDALRKEETK